MTLKDDIQKVTGGIRVAAVATVSAGKPAVRFMVLEGFEDMSLVGITMLQSRKIEQIKKKPDVALSIWSGKEFSDPYVVIQAKASIHEDLATKKKYWNPMQEQYIQKPENPNYAVLKFIPDFIEYYHEDTMEVWRK